MWSEINTLVFQFAFCFLNDIVILFIFWFLHLLFCLLTFGSFPLMSDYVFNFFDDCEYFNLRTNYWFLTFDTVSGMILQPVFMEWISLLFWSVLATVLAVAEGASPVLEFSTVSQRRMLWSGFRWNMREWSLTSRRQLFRLSSLWECVISFVNNSSIFL